jgi:hypothetical protein
MTLEVPAVASAASTQARAAASRLKSLAAELPHLCEGLAEGIDASLDLPTVDQIRRFKFISDVYEAFSEAKKHLNDIYDKQSREHIPEAMRRDGIKTINVDGVGRVSLSNRYSCSILDKSQAYNWLAENGAASLITQTVNSSSLAAFAKNKLEEEGVELPAEVFKTGVMTYTSITKK